MSRKTDSVYALALMTATACTSDLPAPGEYVENSLDATATDTAVGAIMVNCGMFPTGAIDATYDHMPSAMGGDDFFTWGASGLPAGLVVDATSGRVTGAPTEEGMFTVSLTVDDTSGGMGGIDCDLVVNPRVELDFDMLLVDPPFCIQPGQSLNDFVIPGTGDGSPITCDHRGQGGDGKLPAGISIGPDSCAAEGTITETRFGTWVFIGRGTQSDVEVHAPYCVTQDQQEANAYGITVTHSALAGIDATLIPIFRRFNPSAALSVGGAADPRFEIVDPGACGGNACFFGFAFSINSSPFDADTFTLDPNELLNDANGDPIGFFHEMAVGGPAVAEQFRDRPWTVNVSLDYCITDNDVDCTGVGNIRNNGNGNLEIAILMVPE